MDAEDTTMAAPSSPAAADAQTHFVNGEHDEDIKLIVLNYGKWKDAKSMDQFLREHGVTFRKVQKSRQLSFGFVHFNTQEERDAALPVLQGLEWNGDRMDVKTALPRKGVKPQNQGHKRQRDESNRDRKKEKEAMPKPTAEDDEDGGAGTVETAVEAPKHAREVVTPWAQVPYEEQLERKEAEMKKVLVKIVRQTRKEYFKKEKRVNVEQQRHRKKQKTNSGEANDAEDNDDTTTEDKRHATFIPTWLTSHGSLYAVVDDVLYSREHEADPSTPWTFVAKAPSVTSIVSFGSELVGATSDSRVLVLKQGPDAMYWDTLCAGPSEPILSLASLRGSLLCLTESGKILKQEGMGRFATGKWTHIAQVEGARSIVLHNGFVYLCCGSGPEQTWQRAPLKTDALEGFEFSVHQWAGVVHPGDAYVGLCSHDHQLIVLSGQSLIYTNPDSEDSASAPVPLVLSQDAKVISGFASHKGLCCPMDSIHASPSTVGYRNKCEFSIGFDAEEKPCVGFRMGLFRDGLVIVSPPTDCVNVSPVMVKVCEAMQSLVDTSDVPVYDVKTQTGVWRQLTVRYSERTQQLMVVLQINPKELSDEDKQKVYELTRTKFTDAAAVGGVTVTSLYIQEYAGVSAASEDEPLVHLHGSKTIEEHLLGKRFSISPNAFFQVNTPGAETLYSLVKQHANADLETLLYDVCCGTGTIGICASVGAAKVVGIEICKAATDDAVVNAELNGVTNVSFVNSKAEDVMRDLLKAKLEDSDKHLKRVVAIVDPPRAGLHHQVLRSLRSCPPVDRIVYVSCNPTGSLIQDTMVLCGPKTKSITGNAFRPVHAIPVDMFPHTPHCEMIIVFDRIRTASQG